MLSGLFITWFVIRQKDCTYAVPLLNKSVFVQMSVCAVCTHTLSCVVERNLYKTLIKQSDK